ncbi:hypothetical protein D351_00940 [Enterococcus faecalis WKS-26-18-2]|nr:hypothetical protein D351_00940 [Enterococcus faecalis WKS-26-18-2]
MHQIMDFGCFATVVISMRWFTPLSTAFFSTGTMLMRFYLR